METDEQSLAAAWQRTTARHALLTDVALPPLAESDDELDEWAESAEETGDDRLFLMLDEEGTVHGRLGAYHERFATRDLDEVVYLIAEAAMRQRADGLAEAADLLDRIDPAWGRRFRGRGPEETGTAGVCGRDPLEGLAWAATPWREQDPYTHLAFFRAAPGQRVDAEKLALVYGADPAQVAGGTRLRDLKAADDGRTYWDRQWKSCCFGEAGGWTYLLHHDTPPGGFADQEAYAALGIREQVWLSATMAKAIYTFDYIRDGHRVGDGDGGTLELSPYERGYALHPRGGELEFLNRAVRRAELDHPELTDDFQLYFHALEDALGLRLPRQEFAEGEVRAAYWAGGVAEQ
ncbi:hypothetical protein [Streptomyces sp. NPDC016845]|uniref:hypothetical protein n=1 Tax=Streptomyces sp. NPDC016845 TaxID=3364972 RepID=UPI00378BE778